MTVSPTQAAILDAIKRIHQQRGKHTAITYQELADLAGVSWSTVQRHTARMDSAGLLAREPQGGRGVSWGFAYELFNQ